MEYVFLLCGIVWAIVGMIVSYRYDTKRIEAGEFPMPFETMAGAVVWPWTLYYYRRLT